MFSAFQTFGKLGALASSVARAWTPLALWPNGVDSAGMWISPSTLPASFNDSAGTTPVATPGTVADSANPVGLALDIRAGGVLGPELVTNGDFSNGATGWNLEAGWSITGGKAVAASVAPFVNINQTIVAPANKRYLIEFDLTIASGNVYVFMGTSVSHALGAAPRTSIRLLASGSNSIKVEAVSGSGFTGSVDNISVREIPGNHLLQATSTARPLLSAYDGQTLGPGDTYPYTGFPVYQHFDGTDDGMATASFAAGTLTSAMDCLIAVRRDAAANAVCGLYESVSDANKVFGIAESGSGSGCVGSGAGTPTVWVDGVQLSGGTAVTRGTLHTALTVGDYHILEFRGLDLSTWTAAGFGLYTSYLFPGARGDIMLFPSTASTEDKDAARQYLADKYGVTLP